MSKADRVKTIMADIIYNHPDEIPKFGDNISAQGFSDLLKEKYKIDVTRQTISRYLQDGVQMYRKDIIIDDNDKIIELKNAMAVQKSIWESSNESALIKTKASQAWRALQKQLIDYEKQLMEAQVKMAEVSKPNYLLKFEPPRAALTCPECGHKWFIAEKIEKNKLRKIKVEEEEDGNIE